MSESTITRQQGLAVVSPTTGLADAQVASLRTGFVLAVLGGITNLGLLGYALYSFGAARKKRGFLALGAAGVAFLFTKKTMTGVLGVYKQMKGFAP